MAYDQSLAARVRALVAELDDATETRMFGGLGFMVGGNLAVGVRQDGLLVRVPAEDVPALLARDNVHEFEMGGRRRPKGWIVVGHDGVREDADLDEFVAMGTAYAASLPPK